MESKFVVICVYLVLMVSYVASQTSEEVELPEGAKTCQIDSPGRDECIRVAIQEMLPRLYKGYPSLNIPPLDPWTVNSTHYTYNRGAFSGQLYIKTATIYGISRAELKDVRTEITEDGMKTEVDMYFPRVHLEGLYKGEGRFNDFKMNSKGYFNVTMKDISTTNKMEGVFEERNGERYLRLTAFDAFPNVRSMKVYATGIFPDAELNKMALDFVNQYWPSMYKDMLPETRDIWEPRMLQETNAFLLRVPFRKMLYYASEKE